MHSAAYGTIESLLPAVKPKRTFIRGVKSNPPTIITRHRS